MADSDPGSTSKSMFAFHDWVNEHAVPCIIAFVLGAIGGTVETLILLEWFIT